MHTPWDGAIYLSVRDDCRACRLCHYPWGVAVRKD